MKIKVGVGQISMKDIASLCGGTLMGDISYMDTFARSVCTDSREATEKDTLFVVTVGERVDAHRYMKSAWDSGCRLFLCQRIPEELEGCQYAAVVAEDTVSALGKLAEEYTARRGVPVVAITGSVGKTTTKELISAVLAEGFAVHKTAGNHNSTIGLPMSMLEADEKDQLSVVEMGMSGLGEIDFMSRIARPRVACITNIGSSHLELLGTRENICRAKLEIASGMPEDGLLILNGDEPLLREMAPSSVRIQYVSLENSAADYFAFRIRFETSGTVFDLSTKSGIYRDLYIPAIGRQFVWAAAFAAAVGRSMGLCESSIRRGLTNFKNAAMRQNITEQNGITFIEDCYNASPESMRAAIDVMRTLAEARGTRMCAVLGDMRELGENSEQFHREIGEYYAEKGGKLLFAVGPLAQNMATTAKDTLGDACVFSWDSYEDDACVRDIGECVCRSLEAGDVVLVKASRAIGAERILAYIKEKLAEGKVQ